MSCYVKREITFVLKNCSFQAWNVFLVFYSSQLVLTSVGACIHKAIGLKQHYWGIDQKIKPLCMKLKSRQGSARVKLIFTIYSFKIRMLERVQPIASARNRTAKSSIRGSPKGCDPKLQSYCSAFQKECKTQAFAAPLQECYSHQSLPAFSHMEQCRPGEGMEHKHLIPNPVWRAGSPVLSAHEAPRDVPHCCTILTPWQPAEGFPWGVQTHRDVSKRLTALHWNWDSWLHCLPLENSHLC